MSSSHDIYSYLDAIETDDRDAFKQLVDGEYLSKLVVTHDLSLICLNSGAFECLDIILSRYPRSIHHTLKHARPKDCLRLLLDNKHRVANKYPIRKIHSLIHQGIVGNDPNIKQATKLLLKDRIDLQRTGGVLAKLL